MQAKSLTRAQLHAKIMRGFSRAIDLHGKGVFLDKVDCSDQGYRKQTGGSMPSLEIIDRALDLEPSVLDDWMRAKGLRVVAEDAVCDSDDLNVLLARVSLMLAEAEHPDSPGGRAIVPQEYLVGEEVMHKLHAMTGRWLARCSDIRKPRAVA